MFGEMLDEAVFVHSDDPLLEISDFLFEDEQECV